MDKLQKDYGTDYNALVMDLLQYPIVWASATGQHLKRWAEEINRLHTRSLLAKLRIFVCSPFSGADRERNVLKAIEYTKRVIKRGHAPFTPHLFYPQFLDDNNAKERGIGMAAGLTFLAICDEVWVFGRKITKGMQEEIKLAKQLKIPIKRFGA